MSPKEVGQKIIDVLRKAGTSGRTAEVVLANMSPKAKLEKKPVKKKTG